MGLFGKKPTEAPADAALLATGAILLNLNSMQPQINYKEELWTRTN